MAKHVRKRNFHEISRQVLYLHGGSARCWIVLPDRDSIHVPALLVKTCSPLRRVPVFFAEVFKSNIAHLHAEGLSQEPDFPWTTTFGYILTGVPF